MYTGANCDASPTKFRSFEREIGVRAGNGINSSCFEVKHGAPGLKAGLLPKFSAAPVQKRPIMRKKVIDDYSDDAYSASHQPSQSPSAIERKKRALKDQQPSYCNSSQNNMLESRLDAESLPGSVVIMLNDAYFSDHAEGPMNQQGIKKRKTKPLRIGNSITSASIAERVDDNSIDLSGSLNIPANNGNILRKMP